jgi:hypothetical protein
MKMAVRTPPFALVLAAAVLASAAPRAAADVVTFDTPGDLANNFNLNGTPGYYVEQVGTGVNGTNAVGGNQVPGSATAVLKNTSFDGTSGGTFTLSMFIKWQIPSSFADLLEVGIVGNATDQMVAPTVPSMAVAIAPQQTGGSGQSLAILEGYATNAGGGTSNIFFPGGSTMTLVVGHFYRLTGTIKTTGQMSGTVEDFGTTGATNLGIVSGGNGGTNNIGNIGLASDPSVFTAFRTVQNGTTPTLDTFTATFTPVPEPSALVLLALAGGVGVVARRLPTRRTNA